MYSVTGSDYCTVDADTVLYEWDYKQFLPLEFYVNFNEDRKVWAERDAKKRQGKQQP